MPAQPCALMRSAAEPAERFADVGALAARVHELRHGAPILLKRGQVAAVGFNATCLVVRFAEDPSAPAIGYAVIGEPPLAFAVQYDLLGAALASLQRDTAA